MKSDVEQSQHGSDLKSVIMDWSQTLQKLTILNETKGWQNWMKSKATNIEWGRMLSISHESKVCQW